MDSNKLILINVKKFFELNFNIFCLVNFLETYDFQNFGKLEEGKKPLYLIIQLEKSERGTKKESNFLYVIYSYLLYL